MDSESKSDNILIRGTNWIGDSVMTLPAIRAVRETLPNAHITLLVKPWVSGIFMGNPDIDEIMLYGDEYKGIVGKLKLSWMIRRKKFETAILFQNAFDAALITWLARIPERIGYLRDMRGVLLTNAVPVDKYIEGRHQIHYYLNIVKSIGLKTADTHPHIFISDREREDASLLLKSTFSASHPSSVSGQTSTASSHYPLTIGINPGATYGSAKRWPAKNFAILIDRINSELNGQVVLFGGRSEIAIANEIIQETQYPSPFLNVAGKTDLRELAALISECNAFVTNDSGPMHMAYALNVPTVAIFGSTDSTATGPVGEGHKVITKNIPCSPCLKRECPEGHLRCMTGITPEEVLSVLKEIVPRERAVFLDKDGTLIKDMNYLNSFEKLEILTGVKEGLKRLKKAGFKLIGITNQSGIARELVDENFVVESNTYLQKELGIDDFFYCPHHPDEKCRCRKPEPLLLEKARLKHRINLKASYMIGDMESDVLMAKRGGAKGILLSAAVQPEITSASHIAKDMDDAVEWIIQIDQKSKLETSAF
jgi:heptosyltransferase-2